MHNFRLVDAGGALALLTGDGDLALFDMAAGVLIREIEGSYSDVAIVNDVPLALRVVAGNPPTVDLQVFTSGNLDASYTIESPNKPYGGRIAKAGPDRVVWQAGNVVRVYDVRADGSLRPVVTIDTGKVASDVAATRDVFVIVGTFGVECWSHAGSLLWAAKPVHAARQVACDGDHVVAFGGLQRRDYGAIYQVVTVYNRLTGAVVSEVVNDGPLSFWGCVAVRDNVLALGRPVYENSPASGQVDFFNLADRGAPLSSVGMANIPLALAFTAVGGSSIIAARAGGWTMLPAPVVNVTVDPPESVTLNGFGEFMLSPDAANMAPEELQLIETFAVIRPTAPAALFRGLLALFRS